MRWFETMPGFLLVAALLCVGFPSSVRSQSADPQAYLTPHNAARSQVSEQGLVWNNSLAAYALSWAQHQRDTANCALRHSNGPYGENIFWGYRSSAPFGPADAVNAWVSEKQYYNYPSNTCAAGQVCGHYTQVVWAKTTKVGCASVTCNDQYHSVFIICSYNPPGNYVGQTPY